MHGVVKRAAVAGRISRGGVCSSLVFSTGSLTREFFLGFETIQASNSGTLVAGSDTMAFHCMDCQTQVMIVTGHRCGFKPHLCITYAKYVIFIMKFDGFTLILLY